MGYPIEIGTHPLQPCTVSYNDGKPLRVKTFVNWEDITIFAEKLSWDASSYMGDTSHAPQKFVRKTFADSPKKTMKFVKVFTLKSYLLPIRHIKPDSMKQTWHN